MSDGHGSIFDPAFAPLELLPEHVAQLRASGISDAVIRERQYESVIGKARLRDVEFAEYQRRPPGLLMPVWAPDGTNGLYQFKPDTPRSEKGTDKVFKYETPAGRGLRIDVPPRCRTMLQDPSIPLWVTEGIKKGDAGASHGLCVATLIGVWGFRGKNEFGGVAWLGDWNSIPLNERVVNICFDSDVMSNPKVRYALDLLTEMLHRKAGTVRHVFLPSGPAGQKVGLDDFLLLHPVSDLERYIITPTLRPEPKQPPIYHNLGLGEHRHLSDTGNGYRFVAQRGEDARYCFPWAKWLTWHAGRWSVDQHGRMMGWAKETVHAIYQEAARAVDGDQARKLAEFAMRSEEMSELAAMLKAAQNELPVTPDDLDGNHWLLNVANGTIDLRTGQLLPHQRADLLTKLAPVAYDPAAQCPTWLAFLERIMPDATIRPYLQNAVGYCLTGDVSEQVLFFLYGVGANGKSTFLNAILGVLGDYARQAAPGLLTVKNGETHPTELANLLGVRFLSTVEITEGRELAEALVKQITGGDPITARRMREDFWSFLPTHKIWLAANHKPIVKGTDYAIWRRVRLIPFDVVIPPAERDRRLADKLTAEYPGILAWMVRGCLAWQREGLGLPETVAMATEKYQKEMDILASFLDDCCILGPNNLVGATGLYKAYRAWCEGNGERYETQKVLSRRMRERRFDQTRDSRGRYTWIGLGLRVDSEASEASEPNSGISLYSAEKVIGKTDASDASEIQDAF